MIGLTGSIRCGNTLRSCFELDEMMNLAVAVCAAVARLEPLILVAQAGMPVLLKAEFF